MLDTPALETCAQETSTGTDVFNHKGSGARVVIAVSVGAGLCVAFIGGWISALTVHSRPVANTKRVLYYVDPMHPSFHSAKPGKAPDCGMELQPVYADAASSGTHFPAPDRVSLSAFQQSATGVETETLQSTPYVRRIRTVGRVLPAESSVSVISAGVDGWVRSVFGGSTGSRVKKGERLAAFYSREIAPLQQAFVFAIQSWNKLKQSAVAPSNDQLTLAARQVDASRESLRYAGMSELQIDQLGPSSDENANIDLSAPIDGQIIERNIAVGTRFMKGQVLYRIADLSEVWVVADILPGDLTVVPQIRSAEVGTDGVRPVRAGVANVPPSFDENGRTGKLRLLIKRNTSHLLPGMVVNVSLEIPEGSGMTLPIDAVLNSGLKAHVFVALGGGQYELRDVETGWRDGTRVEIRNGVRTGEQVATTATFLLDSESRLRGPRAAPSTESGTAQGNVLDAVCGMALDSARARSVVLDGVTYYFCSEACERKFRTKH